MLNEISDDEQNFAGLLTTHKNRRHLNFVPEQAAFAQPMAISRNSKIKLAPSQSASLFTLSFLFVSILLPCLFSITSYLPIIYPIPGSMLLIPYGPMVPVALLLVVVP